MRTSVALGNGPLVTSRLGYGCWRLAGDEAPLAITNELRQRARDAILTAYESGITLFDLADIYGGGAAEHLFGEVLRDLPELRDKIVIVTKAGIRRAKPESGIPYRYDFSQQYLIHAVEGSLRRLGVETIDLWLLHRPDFLAQPEEVAAVFYELRRSGKVREFGVSNFRPSQVKLLERFSPYPLRVNQVQCSVIHLEPFFDGTLDQCLELGITPQAWSPLGGGRLFSERDQKTARLREVLQTIAKQREVSPAAVALAWLIRHPAQIQPIIGTVSPERIRECVQAQNIELSREEWYLIMEAAYGTRLP